MKTRNYYAFVVLVALLCFSACSPKADKYGVFNCEITLVDDNVKIDTIQPDRIELEYPKFITFDVYDSLVFLYSWDSGEGFFNAHSLNTGKHIGYFCERGQGPDQSAGVPDIHQFYKEGGDLKTLIYAFNNRKMMEWNITKSLESSKTVIDTVVPYNHSTEALLAYKFYHKLEDDKLLVFTQPDQLWGETKAKPPKIQLRTIYSDKKLRDYQLFLDGIEKGSSKNFTADQYLLVNVGVSPNNKKAAIVMSYFHQIHILDIESGEFKGFKIKDKPEFSPDKKIWCYPAVHCDDKYIYALYIGEDQTEEDRKGGNIVQVFDWEGNMIRKIELGRKATCMSLDRQNNLIYVAHPRDEQIYRYDLNTIK